MLPSTHFSGRRARDCTVLCASSAKPSLLARVDPTAGNLVLDFVSSGVARIIST